MTVVIVIMFFFQKNIIYQTLNFVIFVLSKEYRKNKDVTYLYPSFKLNIDQGFGFSQCTFKTQIKEIPSILKGVFAKNERGKNKRF